MSTRSTIAIRLFEEGDGEFILSIYCHHDGYPAHNGRILRKHYTNLHKVMDLMALGNLSVLGEEIGERVKFERGSSPGHCLAYGRDRGDWYMHARIHSTVEKWKAARREWCCEYGYLYDSMTGKWKTYRL